jgi:hypothetical protein
MRARHRTGTVDPQDARPDRQKSQAERDSLIAREIEVTKPDRLVLLCAAHLLLGRTTRSDEMPPEAVKIECKSMPGLDVSTSTTTVTAQTSAAPPTPGPPISQERGTHHC